MLSAGTGLRALRKGLLDEIDLKDKQSSNQTEDVNASGTHENYGTAC